MTATDPLRELERALSAALARIANASLDLDPQSRARIQALEGRRVRFDLLVPATAAPRPLDLAIRAGRVVLEAESAVRPDAIVRGNPADLLAWLVLPAPARASVTFEGDESLLRDLAGLLRNYRPDLERPLTRIAGEGAARELMEVVQVGAQTLGTALRAFAEIVGDGAKRSARAGFVASGDLNELLDGIDALSLRVDRLAARVAFVEDARRGTAGDREP